jgi:hypothetical protein
MGNKGNNETMLGRLILVLVNVPTRMLGTLIDLFKKLSGQNGEKEYQMLKKMLRGKLYDFGKGWREESNFIYFSVRSDGITARRRSKNADFSLDNRTEEILRLRGNELTKGVTYNMVILKGALFDDDKRTMKRALEIATLCNWTIPNIETVSLMREKFSDEDMEGMGLWRIFAAHEPFKNYFLYVDRNGYVRWLRACCNDFCEEERILEDGFVFIVSQDIH